MKKLFFGAVAVLSIASCHKERDEVIIKKDLVLSKTSKVYHAVDIDARGITFNNDLYTYFDLDTNEVVPQSKLTDTNWDIAFYATTIKVNGGDNRKGKGGAIVLDELYDNVEEAPNDSKFKQDKRLNNNENENSLEAYEFAVPMGSGNGWYIYDMSEHKISPNQGRTIVVRTGDGKRYAKIKMISYYKGNPKLEDINIIQYLPKTRFYTFDYVIQTKEGEHKFYESK